MDARPTSTKPAPVVDGWLKKLNPMVWLQNRKPVEAKATIARFGGRRRPVQGELSLDSIKVMRNDLSETDVEVVPVKARTVARARTTAEKKETVREDVQPIASASAVAAMAIPELPPATSAWEYLGERLLERDSQ